MKSFDILKPNEQNLLKTDIYSCQNCHLDFFIKSFKYCPYCLNSLISQNKTIIKPQVFISPISRDKAYSLINLWVKKDWFIERGLKKHIKNIENLNLIYIPFWLFEINSICKFKGKKGIKNKSKTIYNDSKDSVTVYLKDLISPASSSYIVKNINKFEPWNILNAESIDINNINDEIIEIYNIPPDESFKLLQDEIESCILDKIEAQTNWISQKTKVFQTEFTYIDFKLLLIPIWITSYKYKDKVYNYIINSQNGELTGKKIKSFL